jgi:hypothetical protein
VQSVVHLQAFRKVHVDCASYILCIGAANTFCRGKALRVSFCAYRLFGQLSGIRETFGAQHVVDLLAVEVFRI